MSIVRNFNLYLNAGNGSAPYINVNQYDQGEQWVFTLYKEDGTKYTPSTGAIVGIKADNRGIINTGTVDADGRVVINETQQMTAAAGIAIFELLIDGDSHGTANFLVNVEQRPGDNADLSDSDLSLIQEAIDSAEVIVEVIGDGDPSEVIGEHVDAWLDNHPEATTTVQDGAITAPKINNSLWDKLLVSEEASGAVASFDDGADDVPVSSLKVNLEPIQTGSGDPSPTNIRPIYPANGKNYLDTATTTSDYITYTQGADYYITASPSNSDTRGWSYANCQYTLTLPAGTYKFVWEVRTPSTAGGRGFRVYKSDGTILVDGYSTAIDTNGASSAFTLNASTDIGVIVKQYEMVARFMIVRSTESNVYVPYQGIAVQQNGKNLFNDRFADYTRPYDYRVFPIKLEQGKTYTLKGTKTGNTVTGAYFGVARSGDRYSNFVQIRPAVNADGDTFTYQLIIDETWTDPKLVTYVTDETAWNNALANYHIQLEKSDTATSYEPYTPTSYPYSLGQSVYGGTVDLATGVLTVDRGYVDLGTLSWTYDASVPRFYSSGLSSLAKRPPANSVKANIICSVYQTTSIEGNQSLFDGLDNCIAFSTAGMVNARDEAYTTAAAFTAAVSGAQLVYELATPTTVQLTPTQVKTLLGYNNISSTGTVDVIYHADTKLYVDKLTAVDNNIIAPTEGDFVATRNYTTNDLVIVNDTLYKVTANIANGGTITPNSNVTQTTLSALIKALS